MAGNPTTSGGAVPSTAANGATGTPCPARNRFSARRSWAMATAAGGRGDTTSRGQPSQRGGRRVLELGGDDGAARRRGGRAPPGRRTARRGARRRRGRPAPPGRGRGRRCRSPSAGRRRGRSGRAGRRRACRSSPAERSWQHERRRLGHRTAGTLVHNGDQGSSADRRSRGQGRRTPPRRGARRGTPAAPRRGPCRRPPASATANRAALVAPASPMANVATGTPAGICTIDNSES